MALKVVTKDTSPKGWPKLKDHWKTGGVYVHNTAQWISGAIKKPGALHAEMGVPQGQSIPVKRLAKAAQAGGKLGQRARLAQTLKGMH